ncbi:hypothetical protein KC973_03535, partial [Candidatus Saccharibacteria bacterium]|nr:hypothetical protein [Candidatus Saccharibacteria bacterium]
MNRRGYTLLEVSLFLAISGALTLVAIVALGPRLNNVRFTSNMRGLQENITKEFINAEGGTSRAVDGSCSVGADKITISASGDSAGSRADCVLVGKLVTFTDTKVLYRSVVASYLDVPSSECNTISDKGGFDGVRSCNVATVINEGQGEYGYPGGLAIEPITRGSIGYLRSPNGNALSRFTLPTFSTDEIAL